MNAEKIIRRRKKTVWDVETDSGICDTLKDTLSRSQATPWTGILLLSVHSPLPQDHVPKCCMGDTFFCETAGEKPNVSPSSERDTGSWWDDCIGWGKPTGLGHEKGITGMSNGIRKSCVAFQSLSGGNASIVLHQQQIWDINGKPLQQDQWAHIDLHD